MSTEPIPLYAHGYFFLHMSGLVDQIIVFDYYDPECVYSKIISSRGQYISEIDRLMRNMQYFLDQETVLINGVETTPTVTSVEIGLRSKPEYAYIVFTIEFRGELKHGLNTYENIYEEEEAEYEYIVYWFFPEKTRIVKAELGVPYRVDASGRVLFFKVKPGTKIGGREAIYFRIEE